MSSINIFILASKCPFLVKDLVLGEKLFEGKGKSGPGFIKWVGMEGIAKCTLGPQTLKAWAKLQALNDDFCNR
jgi:hypothetical protein